MNSLRDKSVRSVPARKRNRDRLSRTVTILVLMLWCVSAVWAQSRQSLTDIYLRATSHLQGGDVNQAIGEYTQIIEALRLTKGSKRNSPRQTWTGSSQDEIVLVDSLLARTYCNRGIAHVRKRSREAVSRNESRSNRHGPRLRTRAL